MGTTRGKAISHTGKRRALAIAAPLVPCYTSHETHRDVTEDHMAAPMSGKQAPGFFRLKVGDYEVTVLSDGGLALDATLFAGDEAGKHKLLGDAHLPKGGIPTRVNTWLFNPGATQVLVDTGGGQNFAPTLGRLPQNLAAAGVD